LQATINAEQISHPTVIQLMRRTDRALMMMEDPMIERARMLAQQKPWGVLAPSLDGSQSINRIGEIWYERPDVSSPTPELLLKLLFTSQPLSVQVHPTDAYAQSIGLPNGKTEAWYVLSAEPGAKVAVGLKDQVTMQTLRDSIVNGSISDQVAWREVHANDVVFVPAGTIHAIGAGLVIAEIQQRSDATFRVFDHGRSRTLHVEDALAVAARGPAEVGQASRSVTGERTVLVANNYFVFERIQLPPQTTWVLNAARETWLLLLTADARAGSFELRNGDAIYAHSDRVEIESGSEGLQALVAYTGTGGLMPQLLEQRSRTAPAGRSRELRPASTPAVNPGVHS
jgi:mannose-6-phosphate isomerase